MTDQITYTVRRPGCAAWAEGIASLADAIAERDRADRVCAPGHQWHADDPAIDDELTVAIGAARDSAIYPGWCDDADDYADSIADLDEIRCMSDAARCAVRDWARADWVEYHCED